MNFLRLCGKIVYKYFGSFSLNSPERHMSTTFRLKFRLDILECTVCLAEYAEHWLRGSV